MKKNKTAFKWNRKTFKNGSYSILMALIVVAVALVLNMVAGQLPAKFMKLDFSSAKLYTLGDKTEEVVKNLKGDVTLYLIAEIGKENKDLKEVLSRYQDLSPHIKVRVEDPSLNPNFVKQYTEEEVAENSIIVAGEKRNKVIPYSDMYETTINYNTYSQEITGFDGEGQITSAVSYVSSEDLTVMYALGGHNEAEITSSIKSSIEKENIEIKDLNLVSSEKVPEDADCLFLFMPQSDLSSEEAEKIITYLEGGGKAMMISGYTGNKMPNFESVLQKYGVESMDGVVVESDSNRYASGNPLYLLPDIGTHDITKNLDGRYILMPIAQGIKTLENNRETLSITNLLTTSDKAYIKADAENMTSLSKEEKDQEGSFVLGTAISETVDDKDTKIVYFTNGTMLSDQIDSAVSGANIELLNSSLSWMCDQQTSVSIPSKSLEIGSLTLSSSAVAFLSSLTTIILPLLVLLTGGVIWFRRRRR